MGKTIIQTIGPLYGEVVNGTVFGRPNGSIFVPLTNTIKATLPTEYIVRYEASGNRYFIRSCTDAGVPTGRNTLIAESQDTASYMAWELSTDPESFDSAIVRNYTPGTFNMSDTSICSGADIELTQGTKYYIRGVLYASTGVPVATSEVFEVTGVVVE